MPAYGITPSSIKRVLGPNNKKKHTEFKKNGTMEVRHAHEIYTREYLAGRRSKLECLLYQQYVKSFGNNESMREQLKKYISDFVISQDNLIFNQNQINVLEVQVSELLRQAKANKAQEKQAKQESSIHVGAYLNREGSTSITSTTDESPSKTRLPDTLVHPDWSTLCTILDAKDEQLKLGSQKVIENRKLKFRSELDQQLIDKQKREVVERTEKDRQHQLMIADQREVEADRRRLLLLKEAKVEAARLQNEQEMENLRRRRDSDREQRIAEEKKNTERLKQIEAEEEKMKAAKKEASKRMSEKVLIENERNKSILLEQKRVDSEYEAKLAKDYAEKMDREEIARASAFNKRMDALKASQSRFERTAGQEIKQKERHESERTLASVEKELREREAREKAKTDARKAEALKSKDFNASLIERKRMQKEQEQVELRAIRARDEEAAEQQRIRKADELEHRRIRMQTFREQLDTQVKTREEETRRQGILSPVEALLNKSIVDMAAGDVSLLSRGIRIAPKIVPSQISLG